MDKIILDLCGGSGAWSKPYKDAGYDVRLVTLPDNDVRYFYPPNENIYGIFAAPPCTEFSIVKNHNLKRDMESGLELVRACEGIIKQYKNAAFYAIENPVGYLSKYLGKPQYIFQPWWFGDPWTKRTALWGHFNEPIIKYSKWEDVAKNNNLYIRPNREKPSIAFLHKSAGQYIESFKDFEYKTDADFRSITPQGFAKAFFEANH